MLQPGKKSSEAVVVAVHPQGPRQATKSKPQGQTPQDKDKEKERGSDGNLTRMLHNGHDFLIEK